MITKGKAKGKKFYFGFFHIFRQSMGTFSAHTDFFIEVAVCKIIEALYDPVSHLKDRILTCTSLTSMVKMRTAAVTCPGMIQGTVVTKNITGGDFEHTKDLNESVEDLVVEDMAQSFSKVREGTLARNSIKEACVGTIAPSFIFIVKSVFQKILKIGKLLDIMEKV